MFNMPEISAIFTKAVELLEHDMRGGSRDSSGGPARAAVRPVALAAAPEGD
jgi:hypothetical protein